MDRKRILLIDDEVTFTRILKTYLEQTGRYEVYTANSGREGVTMARIAKPNLILLDIIMPDLDGSAVAAELREDEELKRIPVIFLTAVVSREEATTRSGVIGGQFFIAKPVGAKDVLGHLERYLGGQDAVAIPRPEIANGR
ncbi:MAG: response regulator [Candidatus Omnitrophica bacterium]|nr:response regulator [Candidatus Omnitrophota bacterium]